MDRVCWWGSRAMREFTYEGLTGLSKAEGKDMYRKQQGWVGLVTLQSE